MSCHPCQERVVAAQHFESDAEGARSARRFARAELEAHDRGVAATAELLVSELASNVVRHAATPFTVTVEVAETLTRVSVADGLDVDLRITAARGDATSGRGLQILDALADRWGVARRPSGKRVWFELDLPPHPS